jgi:hypothetical protein
VLAVGCNKDPHDRSFEDIIVLYMKMSAKDEKEKIYEKIASLQGKYLSQSVKDMAWISGFG